HCNRLANDIASADNDSMFTRNVNSAALNKLDNASWRAWQQAVIADYQITNAFRVETVHIFIYMNGVDNSLLVNMFRERQLYKNAVNRYLIVQTINNGKQLILAGISRKTVNFGIEAKLLAGFFLR